MRLPKLLVKLAWADAFREAQLYGWLLVAGPNAHPGGEGSASWVKFDLGLPPYAFDSWLGTLTARMQWLGQPQFYRAYDREDTQTFVREADEQLNLQSTT